MNSVGAILLCAYKSCLFSCCTEFLFSPVQSVLVGGIRVSVSGGPRPGSITDVWLRGASYYSNESLSTKSEAGFT